MVNYLDLKYLRDVERKLRAAADDPAQAREMKRVLDDNPVLREHFSDLYVRCLRTIERDAR